MSKAIVNFRLMDIPVENLGKVEDYERANEVVATADGWWLDYGFTKWRRRADRARIVDAEMQKVFYIYE